MVQLLYYSELLADNPDVPVSSKPVEVRMGGLVV